jgi:hypothetical protein
MRHALLAALLLLSTGCSGPLLFAELVIPEVELTLPAQPFPASVAAPSAWCDATRPSCIATDLTYDLGQELELFTRPEAEYELRLTALAIALSSTGGDLGGVTSTAILAYPPDGGAPVTLAHYERSPSDPAPTTISVAGNPEIDLAQFLEAGQIRLRVELTYDARTPAFDADVTADFHVRVQLDYGALL